MVALVSTTENLSSCGRFLMPNLFKPSNQIFSIPKTPASVPDIFVDGVLINEISTPTLLEEFLHQSPEWKAVIRLAATQAEFYIFLIPHARIGKGVPRYIGRIQIYFSGVALHRIVATDETQPSPLGEDSLTFIIGY